MKRIVFATLIALGFGTPSVFAADMAVAPEPCTWTGVIGGFGSLGSTSDYYDGNGTNSGIFGKVNVCDVFGSGLGLQSDTYAEYADATSGDFEDYDSTSLGLVEHLYYRNDSYALGLLAGIAWQSNSYWSGYDFDPMGVIGVDAQIYMGNLTLASQFAYWDAFGNTSDNAGQTSSAWQVSGEARYFITDNFKLSGRVAYDWSAEKYYDSEWKAWTVGVGTEYQFEAAPVSLFANFAYNDGTFAYPGTNDLSNTMLAVGMSVHFNNDHTLMWEDRNGASFATPEMDNWTNVGVSYWR